MLDCDRKDDRHSSFRCDVDGRDRLASCQGLKRVHYCGQGSFDLLDFPEGKYLFELFSMPPLNSHFQ